MLDAKNATVQQPSEPRHHRAAMHLQGFRTLEWYGSSVSRCATPSFSASVLGHADVNITYNLYIHLYGDGFDEMYEALVGNG